MVSKMDAAIVIQWLKEKSKKITGGTIEFRLKRKDGELSITLKIALAFLILVTYSC